MSRNRIGAKLLRPFISRRKKAGKFPVKAILNLQEFQSLHLKSGSQVRATSNYLHQSAGIKLQQSATNFRAFKSFLTSKQKASCSFLFDFWRPNCLRIVLVRL